MENLVAPLKDLVGATLVRVYYFELPYDRTAGISPAQPHFQTHESGIHSVDHCINILTNRGLFELEWTALDGGFGIRCRLNPPPGVYYEFAEIWDVTKEPLWLDVAAQAVTRAEAVSPETITLEFANGRTLYISAAEFNDDGDVEGGVDNILVAERLLI